MRMICPQCRTISEGKFCPECGAKNIPVEENPSSGIGIGDHANIMGGISSADSHNVHNESHVINNVTHVAAQKSEMEALQEKKNIYLAECKRAFEDNILESAEERALEECRIKLGLDTATAKSILESVRLLADSGSRKTSLNPIAKTKLKLLSDNLQNNNVSALMEQINSLEATVKKYDHEELARKYFLTAAVLAPEKCIELKESSEIDNYWKSYWSYLAYLKTGKTDIAYGLYEGLDRFADYPEDNLTVLAVAGALMSGKQAEAKEYLDAVTGEYTPELQKFVDSVYLLLNPGMAKTMGAEETECAFYLVNMFGQEDPKVKEAKRKAKEEAERLAKEEDERKAKAEAERKEQEEIEAKRLEEENKRKAVEEAARIAAEKEQKEAADKKKAAEKKAQAEKQKEQKKLADEKKLCDEDMEKVVALWDSGEFEQAIILVKKWDHTEHPIVLNYLANAYNEGIAGYKKNKKKALELLTRSADAGFDRAQHNLAILYATGDGVAVDMDKAFYYFSLAADQGLPVDKLNLSRFYLEGLNNTGINVEKGISLIEESCELGYPDAIYQLGRIYTYGWNGISVDYKKGFEYIKRAATEFEIPNAICILADYYWSAIKYNAVKYDDSKAFNYYLKAANLGDPDAQYVLGNVFLNGELGQSADVSKAAIWLSKSADQGDEDAKKLLEKISGSSDFKQNLPKGVSISSVAVSQENGGYSGRQGICIKATIAIDAPVRSAYCFDLYRWPSSSRADWVSATPEKRATNYYAIKGKNNLLALPLNTQISNIRKAVVVKTSPTKYSFDVFVEMSDILNVDAEYNSDFHIIAIDSKTNTIVLDKFVPYRIKSYKSLLGSRKWEFELLK